MTPLLEEQVEILRRIAERARAQAVLEWHDAPPPYGVVWSRQVDLWQHMLDEIGRLKP